MNTSRHDSSGSVREYDLAKVKWDQESRPYYVFNDKKAALQFIRDHNHFCNSLARLSIVSPRMEALECTASQEAQSVEAKKDGHNDSKPELDTYSVYVLSADLDKMNHKLAYNLWINAIIQATGKRITQFKRVIYIKDRELQEDAQGLYFSFTTPKRALTFISNMIANRIKPAFGEESPIELHNEIIDNQCRVYLRAAEGFMLTNDGIRATWNVLVNMKPRQRNQFGLQPRLQPRKKQKLPPDQSVAPSDSSLGAISLTELLAESASSLSSPDFSSASVSSLSDSGTASLQSQPVSSPSAASVQDSSASSGVAVAASSEPSRAPYYTESTASTMAALGLNTGALLPSLPMSQVAELPASNGAHDDRHAFRPALPDGIAVQSSLSIVPQSSIITQNDHGQAIYSLALLLIQQQRAAREREQREMDRACSTILTMRNGGLSYNQIMMLIMQNNSYNHFNPMMSLLPYMNHYAALSAAASAPAPITPQVIPQPQQLLSLQNHPARYSMSPAVLRSFWEQVSSRPLAQSSQWSDSAQATAATGSSLPANRH